ncbi:neprilysin-21 [Drosophila ficusphila]|uniref:neprilysin-21 n=1 Tax=Drosophila ficusphila TaxID=30025 RepID=UPI0007E64460|nr:neprilysin-21 [Drosophila ficusphila]
MMWIVCLLLVPFCCTSGARRSEDDRNTWLLNNTLGYVNENASACVNFFEHACGKYGAIHIDDPFTEITEMLDHKVNTRFVQLMDELNQRSRLRGFNESSVEAKVLRFYLTCRGASKELRSVKNYLRLAPPDEGLTWPQLTPGRTAWPEERFEWLKTLGVLHRYGLTNVIVSVLVIPSLSNSSEFLLDLSMPSFQEGSSFTETLAALRVSGVPRNSAPPIARKISRLESALRVLAESDKDDEDKLMNVDQLERRTGLNWRKFVELVIGHSISPQFRVQVRNLIYFAGLKRIMDSSDAQMVANYIMVRFVRYLLEESEDDGHAIECIKVIRRSMGPASNLIYKQRFLAPAKLQQYTQEIVKIFDQVRQQFLIQIERNSLRLTTKQRTMVATKVREIILNIGNIPRTLDYRTLVSRHYENLTFPPGDLDYCRNHLKVLEIRTKMGVAQLDRPAMTREEYCYLSDENSAGPYYLRRQNVIVLPFALLQEPLFVPGSHDVFKYSLLGFLLAHELAHSVDSDSVHLDSLGNVHQTGIEILSSSAYTAGLECMNRNPTQYLDERFADIYGVDLAYSTYTRIASEKNLRDFAHISLEQIFFLNLAQFFCGDGAATNFVDHDDDKLRLQQILSGFVPFHRAFGCQSSSQHQKCQVW